eukprot:TRINITY_DN4816_c0_g1_i1.p1 TRINITY_DN4816_c0_g1~~TRINITY_DN4816_c0_g1_i1.p1  ORF type:complete len:239 (+),score=55.94 TRINITY_DN4816_c0_g1_i1:18-734(+)
MSKQIKSSLIFESIERTLPHIYIPPDKIDDNGSIKVVDILNQLISDIDRIHQDHQPRIDLREDRVPRSPQRGYRSPDRDYRRDVEFYRDDVYRDGYRRRSPSPLPPPRRHHSPPRRSVSPPRKRVMYERSPPPPRDMRFDDYRSPRDSFQRHSPPMPPVGREFGDGYLDLYCGGLPFNVREQEVESLFLPFGRVYKITLGHRDFGFVTMKTEDAERALRKLDGTEYKGKYLRINISFR